MLILTRQTETRRPIRHAGRPDNHMQNEAFLKYLSAPTITSGGNPPPAFSLTPDGKLTAKNADISVISTLYLARLRRNQCHLR
ncbi:hypothetical protein KCP75_04420 [Salmonella enterica subsp. enterica]|nr:hypothetical protein KCP75_04420 [Salmonella enterica subsp. enterica]